MVRFMVNCGSSSYSVEVRATVDLDKQKRVRLPYLCRAISPFGNAGDIGRRHRPRTPLA